MQALMEQFSDLPWPSYEHGDSRMASADMLLGQLVRQVCMRHVLAHSCGTLERALESRSGSHACFGTSQCTCFE